MSFLQLGSLDDKSEEGNNSILPVVSFGQYRNDRQLTATTYPIITSQLQLFLIFGPFTEPLTATSVGVDLSYSLACILTY